jgi:hypothetical protein
MPRVSLLVLALSVLTAPLSAQHSPSTPVEVAYVVTNGSLQTYDVDPTTGVPTAEGQPLTIPTQGALVVPSADDHFLYVFGLDSKDINRLWVYSADLLGVPHRVPLQILDTPAEIIQFKIDPNRRLAYASDFSGKIWLFTIDPETGLVGKHLKIVATSKHNGPCGTRWYDSGLFLLDGFNSDGSRLYQEWDCISFDTYGAHYYVRDIDRSTGKLGANREIFAWDNSGGAGDGVSFTEKSMIDFYNSGGGPDNAVNIYPPSGGSKPLFSCYVTMLQACGYAVSTFVDPAGEYLFLQISDNVAQIAKIDMTAEKIVDTGDFVPAQMRQMSPDRILLYTTIQGSPNAPIYVFDPKTGAVQPGGTIEVSAQSYWLVLALRQQDKRRF